MLFSQVIGQHEIKARLLRSASEGRVSHAQMFFGPEGSGKLALSLAYAQYISCPDRTESDSCGTCPSCLKYEKLVHPDLHFVFPVIKQGTSRAVSDIFLKEWREQVIKTPYFNLNQWMEVIGDENKQGSIYTDESSEILRKLNLKTFESDWKVMIIWLPEKMQTVAANKLLKILEEPPPQTLFLMVCENTRQIIPTILSRVQILRVPAIDDPDLTSALMNRSGLPEEKCRNIVIQANGSFIRAMELLDADASDENFNHFVSLMRLAYGRKVPELLGWVDKIASQGREKQKEFLVYALRLLRENLMIHLRQPGITHMADHELDFSGKFAAFITPQNVFALEREFNLAYQHVEGNCYDKVLFFDLSLKVMQLIRSKS
jgi:DNA polymerase-3 subunit delta'